ncbi:MAG: type I glutamate--ammonia ligase [Candidatus Dadabacteria bacterium]|nr:MAG: type I glutamate--ammonia ligase [Candidatus Dadabacteria bacterium]
MTPKEVLEFAEKNGVRMVDFKFCDLPGTWQHFATPISELSEEVFEHGLGFDGSSIRGWQAINESDMLVVPDPNTAVVDPFYEVPTLSLICDIREPLTLEPYSRDPRGIAKKAVNFLRSTGIGDTAYFGPEPEFFILDSVRFEQRENTGFYEVDSVEGWWNTADDKMQNLGHKPRYKEGYFPVPPQDSLHDIRTEMVRTMEEVGIRVEKQHHEVATAGQAEIDLYRLPLVEMADALMWYKYIVKNVARRNGKTATFMPKPIFGDNGSGMHTHQSIWKGDQPTFAGDSYGGMSELAMHYIAGILHHAPAICAFSNPTTNSYRRLVPGFEAPVNLAYSRRNRSAAIRIPMYSDSPKAKRIEVRFPDPTANGYLAFSAMLMAGLDGIERKLDPGQPLDKDIYSLSKAELAEVPSVPASLEDALEALRNDHEFLLKGDVFTPDVIETWIGYKYEREVSQIRLRPHPWEFALYYDA